jgi:hypothetical protein
MRFELNPHQVHAQRYAGSLVSGRQPGLADFPVNASSILRMAGSEFAGRD